MKKFVKSARREKSEFEESARTHVCDFNENFALRDPLCLDKKMGITKVSVIRQNNKNKRKKKQDGHDCSEAVQDEALNVQLQGSIKQFTVPTAMRMSFESKESDSTLARQYKCGRKVVNKIKCAIARCYLAVQAAVLSGLRNLCQPM